MKSEERMREDFYKWAYHDLLMNTQRGHVAEYIIAMALEIEEQKRIEWEAYDLMYQGHSIEVKSAAYIQSWKQKRLSTINFNIKPTRRYDYETFIYDKEYKRQAEFYIFCLLKHKDRNTINPFDMAQWDFYILPTKIIDHTLKNQKMISLSRLEILCKTKLTFYDIQEYLNYLIANKDS